MNITSLNSLKLAKRSLFLLLDIYSAKGLALIFTYRLISKLHIFIDTIIFITITYPNLILICNYYLNFNIFNFNFNRYAFFNRCNICLLCRCINVNTQHANTILTALPLLSLSLIASLLLRIEFHRVHQRCIVHSVYSINLLIHSILIVCSCATHIVSYYFISYLLYTRYLHLPYLLLCVSTLLIAIYLLELNVYWIILPSLSFHTTSHISLQRLLLSLAYINLIYLLCVLYSCSALALQGAQLLALIAGLLLLLTAVSSSILLSVYTYLLLELTVSFSLYAYLYISYLHVLWVWGHIEVYVLCIPQLTLAIIYSLDNSIQLFDENAIAVSCVNIAAVSSLTWAHHIYSVNIFTDIVNLYSAVSLCIAISTSGKLVVLASSYVTRYQDNQCSYLSSWCCVASVGGVSGVYITLYSINTLVHASSVVCGHCHFILSLGFAISLILYCVSITTTSAFNSLTCLYRSHGILCVCIVPVIVTRRVISGHSQGWVHNIVNILC